MLRARSRSRYRHRGQRENRRSQSRCDKRAKQRSRSRSKPHTRRERGKGNMMYCATRPLHGFRIFDDTLMSISSSPERSEPSTNAIDTSRDATRELDVKVEPREPDSSAQGITTTEQLPQGELERDQKRELDSKEDQGGLRKKQCAKLLCAEDDAANDATEKDAEHAQELCENSEQDPISPVKFDGYESTDAAFPKIDGNESIDAPVEIQRTCEDETLDDGEAPQGTDVYEPMDEGAPPDSSLLAVPCAGNTDPSTLQEGAPKGNEAGPVDEKEKPQIGDSLQPTSVEQATSSSLNDDICESVSGDLKPELEAQCAISEVPPIDQEVLGTAQEKNEETEKPIETDLASAMQEENPYLLEELAPVNDSEKMVSVEEDKDNAVICEEQ